MHDVLARVATSKRQTMRERSQDMWMEDAKAGRWARASPIDESTTAVPPRPKVLQHTDARAHLELAQLTYLLHYYGTRPAGGCGSSWVSCT